MCKQNINLPPQKPSIEFEFNSPPPKLERQETARFIFKHSNISQPQVFHEPLRDIMFVLNPSSNDIPENVEDSAETPEVELIAQLPNEE